MANKRICSVDGCGKPHDSKGFCKLHARRYRENNSPELVQRVRRRPLPVLPRRVQAVVEAAQPANCVIWPYNKNKGYAEGKMYGRSIRINRFVCQKYNGEPPSADHVAAHSCDNPMCIAPWHIRWATHQENMQDRQNRNRQQRGSRHYCAKLTESDIPIIRSRRRRGEALDEIAATYEVNVNTVMAVVLGKTWKHVP